MRFLVERLELVLLEPEQDVTGECVYSVPLIDGWLLKRGVERTREATNQLRVASRASSLCSVGSTHGPLLTH